MSTLADLINREIATSGPIPISQFMARALFDPDHGYYTSQTVFGAEGDFITAPEISQMFGELVGLALAQTWMDQGCPAPFQLVELGPGRGTLMADILRATRGVDGFHSAARIILVEASPQLRDLQAKALAGHDVSWVDTVLSLDACPAYIIANEFFDALPIRQFQRIDAHWHERMVGVADDTLTIGLGGVVDHPALTARIRDTQDGDIVELCPTAQPIMAHLSQIIETHGGCGLIFDYGDWRSLGDTLQAMKAHDYSAIFENVGKSDITAHVDFEALVADITCAHSRLTPQGVWLERMGITARAQALAKNLSGHALENHIHAHRRLTHPQEMGTLFKVIALYPTFHPCPVGFEP